jgi:hypothetical protein
MVDKTVIIAGTSTTIVKKVVVGPPIRSVVQAAGQLATLSDVNVTGVSDGNLLAYDSATSKWIASNALPPVNVVAGTYGSATEIPVFTILSDGRIDSASTVTVAGVTDFNYDSASGKLTISTADGSNFETVISLDPFTTGSLQELMDLLLKFQFSPLMLKEELIQQDQFLLQQILVFLVIQELIQFLYYQTL